MAKIRQFCLLLWKNFKLQFRHPWVTFLELIVPTLFSIILVWVRTTVTSEYVSDSTTYEPFGIDSLPYNLTPTDEFYQNNLWKVLYSPCDTLIDTVMEKVSDHLKVDIKGFKSEEDMLEDYNNATDQSHILAGVVFQNQMANMSEIPSDIKYTVRPKAISSNSLSPGKNMESWFTEYTFPLIQALGPRNKDSRWGGSPGYMSHGFLPLQHAVAMSVIKTLKPDAASETFHLQMQRYPYPPYDDDKFLLALQFFFPLVLILSFIYPALNIVKNLVIEKEKKLKEAMKMMGLSNWMHLSAWYLKYMLFLTVFVIIITVLLSIKFSGNIAVLNKSDPSVVFVLLMVYTAATICFCFFLSAFFSKANSAAAGAGIVFFLTFIPYFFIYPRYNQLTHSEKLASCLLPNTALAMATMVLTMWESSGVGMQWDNLSIPASPDDTLTMGMIFTILIIDGIVYTVLLWYIEAVFPGDYGVPEHWYFPFTKTYWCGTDPNFFEMTQFHDSSDKNYDFYEPEPNLMPGIQIQGLSKAYNKTDIPAVNNVNINMFRGQITVLLGHNGAGKTTTISMLTGLFPPTSGTAIVNGYDICDDIDSVHSGLGICPQHDVLFDDLTVEEHLYFFCKLKGYISDLVKSEVNRIIAAIGLEDKQNSLAKTLSGGMKRRLSVGIALVGGSQVIMLDEPTSGMDPSARRFTWDLLQAEKEDRTILLTTHFMEEADILGDRIAIMAKGEVQCCGSPLFLKKKYGAGYHLVMVKEPNCDVTVITNLIHSYVPNAEISNDIGAELTYVLPHTSSHSFEKLFSEIENKKDELKISSYGASITTMEEVFIKVGQKALVHDALKESSEAASASFLTDSGVHVADDEQSTSTGCESFVNVEGKPLEIPKNTGLVLFFQQLWALLQKRILYTSRNWPLTLSQLILPPFFLILTLVMLKTFPKPHDSPLLLLNLDPFHGTSVPYALNSSRTEEEALKNMFVGQFDVSKDKPVVVNVTKENIISYLINEGINDLEEYTFHNIISLSIARDTIKNLTSLISLFNNQAYHSPGIALLSADNMLLKYFVNKSYSFSLANHPLPRTLREKGKQMQIEATDAYQIAQDLMFGMSFLIASFAIFLVRENACKLKHLQRVSGVNLFSFWLATFAWDFFCYLLPCILILLVFLAFGTSGMSTFNEQGHLLLLLFIHGFAALPFIYVLSFLFQTPSTAYVRLCLLNIVGGIACLMTVTIMEIPALNVEDTAKALDWVFSILLPNYCLGRSVSNLYQNHQFNNLCNTERIQSLCRFVPFFEMVKPCCQGKCGDECIPWVENYFSWNNPGIGKQLIFLVVQSCVFFTLLTACELKLFHYFTYKLKKVQKIEPLPSLQNDSVSDTIDDDDDVAAERQKIVNTSLGDLCTENRLVLKQLTKYYGSIKAVNEISFGVRKGECFGLLGLNGAGKTTTFKMITGDETISFGDIFLSGYDVKTSIRKVHKHIGYCPQFDALVDQLTGKETLTMFARLRGLPEHTIEQEIKKLSNMLSFGMHIDKQVKAYSGGNKRKLSTAVALIGDPPIVFLDEPTTGMDPVSRRCIWTALLQILKHGRSIVLTSHSMEECEALCNRLVIMVNGKLCCIGSPQHLKNKFGQGFTLLAKVGKRQIAVHDSAIAAESSRNGENVQDSCFSELPTLCQHRCLGNVIISKNDIEAAKSFIEKTFEGCILKNIHEGLLHYHIPSVKLNWSQIFGTMEQAKQSLNIEDYSVGQTTLEQVFLNFARAQIISDNP